MVAELRQGMAAATLNAALPAIAERLVTIALTSKSHRASIEAITYIHERTQAGKPAASTLTGVEYEVTEGTAGTQENPPGEDPSSEEGVVEGEGGAGRSPNTEQVQVTSQEEPASNVVQFDPRKPLIPQLQLAISG